MNLRRVLPRQRSAPATIAALALGVAAAGACTSDRAEAPPPTYHTGIGKLLHARCAGCHAELAGAGGYGVTTYSDAVGCVGTRPATAGGANAPLIAVFLRPDHRALLTTDERSSITEWVRAGAPSRIAGVHPASFADPRSPESHGRFLRARRYAPMLDVENADACGACHDGAPARPAGILTGAAGAPACSTCHREPEGALACSTCHAAGGDPFPPRDSCFHESDAGAHRAHVGASASRSEGLACASCHPTPPPRSVAEGTHGNGHLEVWFDYALAGREARFDATSKRCAGTCHDRGGTATTPAWTEGAMTCASCHGSPPKDHYAGACSNCHREANSSGTELTEKRIHVDGKVDLGDGSGGCGACHGNGARSWPDTGAHARHLEPRDSRPVACETCHAVPSNGEAHPIGRGAALVRLSGLAVRGGARATYDTATKTCSETYCHNGVGGAAVSPRWMPSEPATCGSCHASPPPAPHTTSTTCAIAGCHQGVTEGPSQIAGAARAVHVDGTITRGLP